MGKHRSALKDVVVGFIVGVTSMLPGISGATMLVVFGIYERLIRDLANLKTYLRKDLGFIILIIAGFGIGTLLCAKVLDQVLEDYPAEALMFFLGLIIGQIPVLWNEVRIDVMAENNGRYDRKCAVSFLIGFLIMVLMVVIDAVCNTGDAHISHDGGGYAVMFAVGIVVAVSALLPGLSHTTLLLVVGLLTVFTDTISNLDAGFIAAMGVGAVIGLLGFSKVIHKALREHHLLTMLLIVGLTIGSLLVIGYNVIDEMDDIFDLAAGPVCLAVGLLLSLCATRLDRKADLKELNE